MFEIHISDTDVSTGSVAVSWCLDQETIAELNKRNIKNPQVVLVVSPEEQSGEKHSSGREFRKVVPLKDLMTYVELTSSGKNRIWAFISTDKNIKKTVYDTGSYSSGERYYVQPLLNWDGSGYACDLYNFTLPPWTAEPISVDVPDAIFASKPSDLEMKWVNWLKPKREFIDQCDFRRARIFAYTIQPIIFLLNYLFRFIVLVISLAFGKKYLSFEPFIHPLDYKLTTYLSAIESSESFFIREDEEGWRRYVFLPFMPAMLIFEALVIFLICVLYVALTSTMTGNLVLAVLAFFGIVATLVFSTLKYFREVDAEYNWLLEEDEQKLLLCSGNLRPKSVQDLPKKHQTIRLRVQELKTKVCRPFSK